jgi:ribonucleoside-diphosphate reductase alpha chain
MSEVAVTRNGGQVARRIPRVRRGQTTRFAVDGQKGYLTTTGDGEDRVGEVTIKIAKQGSTLAGMMDALGQVISLGLQAGAPLEDYVREFANSRFVPAGRTDDPELPLATSLMDYVGRRLAVDHLPQQRRAEMGVLTADERRGLAGGGDDWSADLTGLPMSAPLEAHP